jgi:hypothetical protein
MAESTRILFVHIPKTAGISLFSALAAAVGTDRAIRFSDASKENREKLLAMPDEEMRRYHLISGHFPLAIYLKKPLSDYRVITVLRDPVDRELSAYYYMKTWKGHPRHEMIKQMDLQQFIEHREKDRLANRQCFILSGASSFYRARKAIETHGIMAAPIDYLGDFCRLLERELHIGPLSLGRENETAKRPRVDEVPAELRSRLETLTSDDKRLYRHVKKKFEQEVLGR